MATILYLSIVKSLQGTSIYNITDGEEPLFNEAIASFKELNNLSFKNIYLPKKLSFLLGNIFETIYFQ